MTVLRFALAQFDFPVGAVATNAARIAQVTAAARAAGCALVAFPELAVSGYPPEDLLLRPSFLAACAGAFAEAALATDGIAALVGHPLQQGEIYNAASLIVDGRAALTARKQALPNYTVFDEQRWFRPGHESAVIDVAGVRVGFLICEDIWEVEPAAAAAMAGAELLVVINASPFDTGQAVRREALLSRRARENGVAIAYVNTVGGQDELLFDGASLLVEPDGRIAARAGAFVEALLIAAYDTQSRRFSIEADDAPGAWQAPASPASAAASVEASMDALVYAGLVRGTHDYVVKNGFSRVLLGLSGGIDSALTLALAVDALGADQVLAVMMPSRHTSELSLREAKSQADALGVEYRVLEIEPAFQAFATTLAPAFAGCAEDSTEENLQARCRGVMLMALSNKSGRLLLSTGNKSEMAVGYATLYGDMCGAYAPLKDVYKTRVYRLARWRNALAAEAGRSSAIPPAVIGRAPSAELRAEQTDQDSLPPYDVLDAILARFIEGDASQAAIVREGFDAATVERIARLVLANEYKRRQSAPGPRITTRAFGRDRRYPISSGWE
jgi:NAD+ synthase (glutamine-hydrolysing)